MSAPPASSSAFRALFLRYGIAFGCILFGALALALWWFRDSAHRLLLDREASLLQSVAQAAFDDARDPRIPSDLTLSEVALQSSELRDVVALATFNTKGQQLKTIPSDVLPLPLNASQLQALATTANTATFYPAFDLNALFLVPSDFSADALHPLLEITVSVSDSHSGAVGFIQFWLDGDVLLSEFKQLDAQLASAFGLISLAAFAVFILFSLRARSAIAHLSATLQARTQSLVRAERDLALSAKASAIGSISAHLVHGLKGPLASLRAYLAQSNDHNPQIAALTDRMQALIHESVNVIQQNEALDSFAFTSAEFATIAKQRFAPLVMQHGGQLSLHCDGTAEISGKAASIALLILRNLIDNAIHACPSNPQVQLRLAATATHLRCELCDNGPGIPEAVVAHLFVPKASSGSGSGIGLALSAAMAASIDARIALVRTGTSGSCFSLELPIRS